MNTKNISQVAPGTQLTLDLGVEVQKDIDGIEMGVLENGISFLTQSGLAKIAGTSRKAIFDISQEWENHYDDNVIGKDRISFIKSYLFDKGFYEKKLFIETKKDSAVHHAYPDIVCMAILEFYSFESKTKNDMALNSYRKLATYGLQKFIYDSLGYTPGDKWKYHNDRVSILKNSSPEGFFVVFHEVTGLIVDLISADLTVNHKTIPDISVGQHWAKYWKENNLEAKFGQRKEFEHNYPDYYPQAESNPQKPWAYPDTSLAEFRKWFKREYLPTKFPKYILSKANVLSGGKQEAEKIASLYNSKQIN